MSDVSDADSDDIADLLGDVDKLDDDLFGGALTRKKSPPSEKPPVKKVSFAETPLEVTKPERKTPPPETTKPAMASKSGDTLDDLFGPTSFARKPAATAQTPSKPAGGSPMDNLFGPTTRKPAGKDQKQQSATSWLGLNKDNEQSSEEDNGFQKLITQKKRPLGGEIEPRQTRTAPAPPKTETPKPKTEERPALPFLQPDYAPPQPKPAPAPVAAPAPVVAQPQYVVQQSPNNDDAMRRLREENERLTKSLQEQREKFQDEEKKIQTEWKDRLSTVQQDFEQELSRVKQLHRQALEEMKDDQQITVQRVKDTMSEEIKAATSAYEHTRSYHELSTKIESAVDQLNSLSSGVTDLQDKTSREREVTLEVRENRVKHLEQRLEHEIADVREEREKIHSILFTLEANSKEQEKLLSQERYAILQERSKMESEKSVLTTEQRRVSENLEGAKSYLDNSKESFLHEQHEILERVLSERELLQQERATFNTQRDRDVLRIKKEATELDERSRNIQNKLCTTIKNNLEVVQEAERAKRSYEDKQTKLIHLEQTLNEECVELEGSKMTLEREKREYRIMQQELLDKKAELEDLKKDANQSIEMRNSNWNMQRTDMQRQIEVLQAKESEMAQKQRELHRQKVELMDERRRLNNIIVLCPGCGHNFQQPTSPTRQAPEKPYDSPPSTSTFNRVGSIRTVLRQHAKELERFVNQEESFMSNL